VKPFFLLSVAISLVAASACGSDAAEEASCKGTQPQCVQECHGPTKDAECVDGKWTCEPPWTVGPIPDCDWCFPHAVGDLCDGSDTVCRPLPDGYTPPCPSEWCSTCNGFDGPTTVGDCRCECVGFRVKCLDVASLPKGDADCRPCEGTPDCDEGYTCGAVGPGKFCLRDCTANSECKGGYVCYPVSTAGKQCLPMSYNCVECAYKGCDEGKTCDLVTGYCVGTVIECGKCTYDFECGDGSRCFKKDGGITGRCTPECPDGVCPKPDEFTCTKNADGIAVCDPGDYGCCPCQAKEWCLHVGDGKSNPCACLNDAVCATVSPANPICSPTTHVCVASTAERATPDVAEIVEASPDVAEQEIVEPSPDAAEDPGDKSQTCGGLLSGTCDDASLSCLCCAAGGPYQHCICSTACQSDLDCTAAARPTCNHPPDSNPGICAPADFTCCWYCK
jgi:hypothetical protein